MGAQLKALLKLIMFFLLSSPLLRAKLSEFLLINHIIIIISSCPKDIALKQQLALNSQLLHNTNPLVSLSLMFKRFILNEASGRGVIPGL